MAAIRAIIIIASLLAVLVLLASASVSVPVNLRWGNWEISSTAPVAVTLLMIFSVLVFYLGRLVEWVARLPDFLRNFIRGNKRLNTQETLIRAFSCLYVGDISQAKALAKKLSPYSKESPLVTLLNIQTDQVEKEEGEAYLAHPVLGPLVALRFSRKAAAGKDWQAVARYTSAGLQVSPRNAALVTLHFKALVNLNDPQAITFLPQLKPLVTRNTYQLLSTIIAAGTTTPHAAALGHPWVQAFQYWLPTPSDTLPDEVPQASRR